MNIINLIVLFLLITPFYAVITDLKSGKIKNYFIFPFLLISFILTFFISWFYLNSNNVIWIIILILFWYFFYKDNKWGAGDWKYIILIWLNSIIISYLLWFWVNIINALFIVIFGLLLLYNLIFLLYNYKNIKKINYKKNKIDFFDTIYIVSFVYIVVFLISTYFWTAYIYLTIFLTVILWLQYINKLKNKNIQYLIIFTSILIIFYNLDYKSYLLIFIIFYIFSLLQLYFNQIYDIIDIKESNLLNIKSWDILTANTLKIIKKDIKKEYLEAPLQWYEVYEITVEYKKIWKNPKISIYNDLKIWIIMYLWYFITIIYYI